MRAIHRSAVCLCLTASAAWADEDLVPDASTSGDAASVLAAVSASATRSIPWRWRFRETEWTSAAQNRPSLTGCFIDSETEQTRLRTELDSLRTSSRPEGCIVRDLYLEVLQSPEVRTWRCTPAGWFKGWEAMAVLSPKERASNDDFDLMVARAQAFTGIAASREPFPVVRYDLGWALTPFPSDPGRWRTLLSHDWVRFDAAADTGTIGPPDADTDTPVVVRFQGTREAPHLPCRIESLTPGSLAVSETLDVAWALFPGGFRPAAIRRTWEERDGARHVHLIETVSFDAVAADDPGFLVRVPKDVMITLEQPVDEVVGIPNAPPRILSLLSVDASTGVSPEVAAAPVAAPSHPWSWAASLGGAALVAAVLVLKRRRDA